ncbi:energy transducer TonB [Lysobacter humi (ex Lee et al. 2017)]
MKSLRCVLLFLALVAPANAGEPLRLEAPVSILRVDGELAIDPAGVPVSFTPSQPLPGSMGARLPEMVAQLRFEPVLKDGRPAPARMPARVTLAAQEMENGNYRIGLENLTFPKHCDCMRNGVRLEAKNRAKPRYPREGLILGADVDVLVAVRVGLDGRIAEAAVAQSALIGKKGTSNRVAGVLEDFERSSLEAVRKWRVDVQLEPGATPSAEDLSGLVIVSYRIDGGGYDTDNPGWIYQVRTTKRPAPWLPERLNATGVADVGGDAIVPAGAPARLISGLGTAR